MRIGAFARSEQRVDEGGNRRALSRHQQSTEQRHGDHHRRQPVFLAYPEESPKLGDETSHKNFLRTAAAWWMIRFAAPALSSSWPHPDRVPSAVAAFPAAA